MSRKILAHPDKEEIIELLTNGESVRNLSAKLKEKYPNSKHLWLSTVTLQKFRSKKLQLNGKVLKDIQEAERVKIQKEEEISRQKQLEATNAYSKKINEIVDSKLDVTKRILQLDKIIEERMEYWYNRIASGEEKASKGDKELRQYIDRLIPLLGQYKKLVEGMADKTIDHNVNIKVVDDQLAIIREVIRECLASFAPEQAMLFMEKLENRLGNTAYRPQELPAPVRLEDLPSVDFEILDGDNNG